MRRIGAALGRIVAGLDARCGGFSPNEFFGYSCGATGVLLLWHAVVLVLAHGHKESDETAVYLLSFSAGPVLSYLLFRWANRGAPGQGTPLGHALLFTQGLLVAAALGYLWCARSLPPWAAYVLSGLHLTAIAALLAVRRTHPGWLDVFVSSPVSLANKAMAVLLPATLCVHVLAWSPESVSTLGAHWKSKPIRIATVVAGLAAAGILVAGRWAGGIRLPRWASRAAKVVTAVTVLLAPLLLFDVDLSFFWIDYGTFVGPANAVLCGRVPLVDVQCQYGLWYLVYALPFAVLGTRSYVAAAVVTSLGACLCLGLFLLIVSKVVRNLGLRWMGGLLAIFFYHHMFGYQYTATPSLGGLRFLPPLLLACALVYLHRDRRFSPWSVAAFVLSLCWSVECAAFSWLMYAAFLLVRGIAGRDRPLRVLGSAGILAGVTAGTFALGGVVLRLWGGAWPRYDLYLKMVAGYGDPNSHWGHIWSVLVGRDFLYWAPLLLAYFLCAAFALRAMAEGPAAQPPGRRAAWAALLPLALLGTLELSYYVGRSVWAVLLAVALPFGAIVLGSADAALRAAASKAARIAPVSLGLVLVLAVSLMAGIGLAPLVDPAYAKTRIKNYAPSLVQNWVRTGRPGLDAVFHQLLGLHPDERHPMSYFSFAPLRQERLEQGVEMVRRWAPAEKEILVFLPEATPLLFYTHKRHKYPISYEVSEQGSEPVRRWIVDYPVALREHEVLFVPRHLEEMDPLHAEVLRKVLAGWDAELVDTTALVGVYRLVAKGACPAPRRLRLPLPVAGVASSGEFDEGYACARAADGSIATLWRSVKRAAPREEWLRLDLGSVQEIGAIRLVSWSEAPQLRPAEFRLEVSSDLQTWETVAAGPEAKWQDEQFCETELERCKARWVRLRAVSRYSPADGGYFVQLAELMAFPP